MKIGLMLFGMKDDFKQMLAKMASDYIGPAGAIPFERFVARHLEAFQELRERGLVWEQVSRLLAGAGILRSDGRSFPPSHLRGVFGRQQKRAVASTSAKPRKNVATTPGSSMAAARPSNPGHKQAARKKSGPADPGEGAFVGTSIDPLPAHAGSVPGGGDLQSDDNAGDRLAAETPHHDRTNVLTLMRQAALARRSG